MDLQIKERLELTLEKYGISQNAAGKEMGYSGSVLSAYRNGAYQGDIGKIEDAIIKWCARIEQAHARKRVPLTETDDLKRICNAIAIAHTEKDIALIVADAGSGKSTAARHYCEQNPRTTIMIQVVSGMNRKMLVQEIAKQLSLDTARVPFQTLIQNTADALQERNIVVILDEADYLKADALEFTRRLVYDLGESGLVLIGLPRLKGMIQNLKNDHRQLESRIGVYLPLSGLSKKDATSLANAVWPACSKDIIEAIYDVSKTDVRQFCKIIERCQNLMLLNKVETPDLELVEMAAAKVIRRSFR